MIDLITNVTAEGLTVKSYLISTAAALICGLIIASLTICRERVSKSFFICLLVLPMTVETVILMVNGNVGTGIAVAGAFSLVRFRSAPGRARDIALIFLAMTSGLACAAGYVFIALLFTAIAECIIIIASFIRIRTEREYDLRITVPETLSFNDAFDEVFDSFTLSHSLIRVKTSNMGSLYKLHYKITPKNESQSRELIDKIRERNGNLEVSLSYAEEDEAL